jgi:hypothetical protein
MPLYFMLHDAERFNALIRPALAASWRQRSFTPCLKLQTALAIEAACYFNENRIGEDESILLRVGPDLAFSKEVWRFLVGEVLLIGAADLPEIPVPEQPLRRLLHGGESESVTRFQFVPIEQALYGARDLVFGGWYRPEHAGYNDKADVLRLVTYLDALQSESWSTVDLSWLDVSDEERHDELEFARASIRLLREMYDRARSRDQIIVCEHL